MKMQICNIICKCVESVVIQQDSISSYPCAFQVHGHSLLDIAAGLSGPNSGESFILDQNRHTLAYSVFSTHLWWERLVFSPRIGYSLCYISVCFPLCCEPKRQKKRNRFFSFSLSLFLHKIFKREETYVILLLRLWGIKYVQHIQA